MGLGLGIGFGGVEEGAGFALAAGAEVADVAAWP